VNHKETAPVKEKDAENMKEIISISEEMKSVSPEINPVSGETAQKTRKRRFFFSRNGISLSRDETRFSRDRNK
jgi:hypothetical protein